MPESGRSAAAALGGPLRRREHAENFPVGIRMLPGPIRDHLRAVYAYARTVDDLGDASPGERTRSLHAFEQDLGRVWVDGRPEHPVLRALVPTVRACGLTPDPFRALVAANLQDQRVDRYDTFEDLLGYCELSANPVGRIVLEVFGLRTPHRVAQSDRVCSALQVLEHCQDIGEDYRAGRVYLPQQDIRRFGVIEASLGWPQTQPALRRLVLAEVDRARHLLAAGRPLVAGLSGWARVCVSGYVAGGLATADSIRRARGEVLLNQVGPSALGTARHVAVLMSARA